RPSPDSTLFPYTTLFRSALLAELDAPLLSSTLLLPGEEFPLTDPEEIRDRLDHQVDLVIDAGHCGAELTSVVNLVTGTPELVRRSEEHTSELQSRENLVC